MHKDKRISGARLYSILLELLYISYAFQDKNTGGYMQIMEIEI